jgi:hypothetical protein
MRTILILLLLGAQLTHRCCATAQNPSPAVPGNTPPTATITSDHPMTQHASFCYERLASYGQWFWRDPSGWVWTPNNVEVGWRPCTEGNWVYADSGWTWVSDFECCRIASTASASVACERI